MHAMQCQQKRWRINLSSFLLQSISLGFNCYIELINVYLLFNAFEKAHLESIC